jgi:F-type H+-transporting ATPase subunit b
VTVAIPERPARPIAGRPDPERTGRFANTIETRSFIDSSRPTREIIMLRRSNPTDRVVVVAVVFLALASCRLAAQEVHKADEHGPAPQGHAAASAPAAEHGTAEEAPNPLKFEPTLALWTLVVFVGLFLLLRKFAWTPLLDALHKRESHLEKVLQDTERARNESETLMAEYRKQLARASDEVRALIEKARLDAQATAEQIVKQAQEESEASRVRAQRDIASARDQALGEIWQKTAEMAVSVAGRVLSKQLTDDDHGRLLNAAIQELPAGVNGQEGHAA